MEIDQPRAAQEDLKQHRLERPTQPESGLCRWLLCEVTCRNRIAVCNESLRIRGIGSSTSPLASSSMDKSSATGTRTRVARVRAEYPNQLDYSGRHMKDLTFNQHESTFGARIQTPDAVEAIGPVDWAPGHRHKAFGKATSPKLRIHKLSLPRTSYYDTLGSNCGAPGTEHST